MFYQGTMFLEKKTGRILILKKIRRENRFVVSQNRSVIYW